MNIIIRSIPNTITCCNLIAGCLATVAAFNLGTEWAGIQALTWFYILVGAAAVFDFCDGLAARLLKAYSAMGKELDSLSDLVSFGVAPGMLMLNIMLNNDCQPWAAAIAILIPVMGALRLARFNIDENQTTTFTGLPIPANAIFWVGFAAFIHTYAWPGVWVAAIAIIIISLCMVAPMRMFSLKFKNLSFADNVKRYGILAAALCFVVIYGITGLMWTIIVYILISLLTRIKE